MQRERADSGTAAGGATTAAAALAAAAMAGALVAFGRRAGDSLHHVNALAGLLLDSRVTFVSGAHPVVTTVGALLLVALAFLWSALFVRLALRVTRPAPDGRRRGAGVVVAACAIAALAFCVDAFVLPRLAGETALAALSLPRLALLHLLLAPALAVGMRLAPPGRYPTGDDAHAAPRVYQSGDDG